MKSIIPIAFSVLIVGLAPSRAQILVNGNFETGGFTGWTNTASATIDSVAPLAGSYSAVLPVTPGTGGAHTLSQGFAPQTSPATAQFIFSMPAPVAPAVRGLQLYLRDSSALRQINLQVVDLTANGLGDVQIYNTPNSAFRTVLTDVVTFNQPTTLSLTIKGYGTSFNYDLTVGGQTVTGLSFYQFNKPTDLAEIDFVNQFQSSGFEVDNVSVTVVPEPATTGILAIGGIAILLARRYSRKHRFQQ